MDPYVFEQQQGKSDNRVSAAGGLPKLSRMLRRAGHMIAMVPIIGNVPGLFTVAASYVAEAGDSLIHGKPIKAIKQAFMGAADSTMTYMGGEMLGNAFEAAKIGGLAASGVGTAALAWIKDPVSLIFTGKTTGEFARDVTGELLDAPGDMMKEHKQRAQMKRYNEYRQQVGAMQQQFGAVQTNGSAMAGVGFAPGLQQEQSRYWFNQEANRRGVQDPNAAYNNYMNGNAEHLAALEDARARGPLEQQRG